MRPQPWSPGAAAAGVAADQADRTAAPAPANANHGLPLPAKATRPRPAAAADGRPAQLAAASAQNAALKMTFALAEPRPSALLIQLPVAPGQPFGELTMDGAEFRAVRAVATGDPGHAACFAKATHPPGPGVAEVARRGVGRSVAEPAEARAGVVRGK